MLLNSGRSSVFLVVWPIDDMEKSTIRAVVNRAEMRKRFMLVGDLL